MSIVNPGRVAAIVKPIQDLLVAQAEGGLQPKALSLRDGLSRDSLVLPVRPVRFKTPGEVTNHVSGLLNYTKAWTEVRNRTQTLLADIAGPLKRAQEALRDEAGVRPLQDTVAKLTRERHAAVAQAKEELAVAERRARNTLNPGRKLALQHMKQAQNSIGRAESDSTTGMVFGSNDTMAFVTSLSASSHTSDAGMALKQAMFHTRRGLPSKNPWEIIQRRLDAIADAKRKLSTVEQHYDQALANPIAELKPRFDAMRAELKPYTQLFREGQALVKDTETALTRGLEAIPATRQGVPRGQGLLWVLNPKQPFDIGDELGDALKQAQAIADTK